MESTTSQLIDLGEAKIAHRRYGSGPDILLIHGWPLSGHTWRNVVAQLSERFTCHVIDLPGSGDSVMSPGAKPDLRTMSDVVGRVIDALGLDSCTLMGHDSGGMVAREVAAARPGQINALVLAETEIPGHHGAVLKLYSFLAKLPGNRALMQLNLRNRFLRRTPIVLGGCFGDSDLIDGEFFDEIVQPLLDDSARMERQMDILRTFGPEQVDALAEVHPKVICPTLLVWGADDRLFFPEKKARAMVGQFGGDVRFESIPGAKLFLHEEHPERLAELATDFLAGVGPAQNVASISVPST